MNYALILAGGRGHRMNAGVPKQFVNVYEKPVIIYTLESFQLHPLIDCIMVVCVDGWEEYMLTSARQFGITKLKWVVKGGTTSQESIRNGIYHLAEHCKTDDVVVIHDGIRPLIEDEVLSDVIVTCRKRGNAVTSMPYTEQIFVDDGDETTTKYIPRDSLRRVATPQAYEFGLLNRRYHEAFERGIGISESSYTNTMMADLGERLFFAMGSEWNIKLTTREDLEMFKAYLKMKRL